MSAHVSSIRRAAPFVAGAADRLYIERPRIVGMVVMLCGCAAVRATQCAYRGEESMLHCLLHVANSALSDRGDNVRAGHAIECLGLPRKPFAAPHASAAIPRHAASSRHAPCTSAPNTSGHSKWRLTPVIASTFLTCLGGHTRHWQTADLEIFNAFARAVIPPAFLIARAHACSGLSVDFFAIVRVG